MSEGGFVAQTSYSKLTQAMKAQHQQGKDLSSIIIFHNHLSLSLSRASLCAQAIHEEQGGSVLWNKDCMPFQLNYQAA